jgi:hypothetical protein
VLHDENYAYCKICCIEIVVTHGGKGDLPKHVKSNKHSKLSKLSETNRKITNSLTSMMQNAAFWEYPGI